MLTHTFHGKSIVEVLALTAEETAMFFTDRARFNAVDWAVVASREALAANPDWSVVGGRLGLLSALAGLMSLLATRAFLAYRRSL